MSQALVLPQLPTYQGWQTTIAEETTGGPQWQMGEQNLGQQVDLWGKPPFRDKNRGLQYGSNAPGSNAPGSNAPGSNPARQQPR